MHKKTVALVAGGAFILLCIYALFSNGVFRSVVHLMVPPPKQDISPNGGGNVFPSIKVPEGFSLTVFADNVPDARVMVLDNAGNLIVSEPKEGKVVALRADRNGDGKSDGIVTLLKGLNRPHGLAFNQGSLYVAETNAASRYAYNSDTVEITGAKETLFALPYEKFFRHTSRTLLIIPDPEDGVSEKLLVSVGSSCDVCHEADERLAAVLIADLNGKNLKVFAKGLRNSVFMALNPVTGQVFATEMGRDWLGDDLPPDEINVLTRGSNYGWPICFGKNNHDTEFDKNTYIRNPCMEPFEKESHVDLEAHSAPLGITFIQEEGWPEEWWYDAVVAYHGSWNRNTPTGYKIVRIPLDAKGKQTGAPVDFISGFMDPKNGTIYGRPVDIMLFPGGSGFISDDRAGVIYRLARTR